MGRISLSGKRKGAEAGLRVGWVFFLFCFIIGKICKWLLVEWKEPGEGEARIWGGGSGRWDREVELFGLKL